ncbi:hypothetical protein Aperf_G00000020409 [Anoplocephala perfoliata]
MFVLCLLCIQSYVWVKSGSILFVCFGPCTHDGNKNQPLEKRIPIEIKSPIISELISAMRHSWKAYTEYAWGMDEVMVLSKVGTRWLDACLTMIDSLDTLWMFNMTEEFFRSRDWISTHVYFDYDNNESNVFESTIRLLGGLLSAYHLSGEAVFFDKAQLIGSKLITAFDSPSGLPYTNVNFRTLKVSLPNNGKTVSLSEVAALQLEFNELAMLCRNASIAKPAANVYKILDKVNKLSGLMSIAINMLQPAYTSLSTITMGARGDSYYEYLLKVWIQTGKKSQWLRNEFITAVAGMREKLIRKSVPNGLTFVGELHGSRFSTKMDHLVCFLPATLAYGYLHGMPADHLELAESLTETCFHLYNDTKTGLSPELVHFNLASSDKSDFYIKRADTFNLLRPETIEALFYLYRITKNPKYQEWGKTIFHAFNTHSRVEPAGYVPLQDVQSNIPGYKDKMESFWMAETLKYFLLLFDDNLAAKFDLREWVFNTEGHPFPIHSSEVLSVVQDLYNF